MLCRSLTHTASRTSSSLMFPIAPSLIRATVSHFLSCSHTGVSLPLTIFDMPVRECLAYPLPQRPQPLSRQPISHRTTISFRTAIFLKHVKIVQWPIIWKMFFQGIVNCDRFCQKRLPGSDFVTGTHLHMRVGLSAAYRPRL